MNREQQAELVKEAVISHFEKNAGYLGLANLSEEERDHIIDIGTSILCTKWEVGFPGGGFVEKFISNDLMGSISRADSVTYKGFKFFASIVHNVGYPMGL